MNARLVGTTGYVAGQEFVTGPSSLLIGRSQDAQVSNPSDPHLSRSHAQVFVQGDAVLITDLGSSNGALVNGQKISAPTVLLAGDLVSIGSQQFRFDAVAGQGIPGPASFQAALKQTPDFATRYNMVLNDMQRNPGKYVLKRLFWAALLFLLIFGFVFGGILGGGWTPYIGDRAKSAELRQSIKVGKTKQGVIEVAGIPGSKTYNDFGPGQQSELWTYNGMNIFVHFGLDQRVQAVTSSE